MKSAIGIIVLSAALAYVPAVNAQSGYRDNSSHVQNMMQQQAQMLEQQRMHRQDMLQQQMQQMTQDRIYEQQQQINNNMRHNAGPGYFPPRYVPRY